MRTQVLILLTVAMFVAAPGRDGRAQDNPLNLSDFTGGILNQLQGGAGDKERITLTGEYHIAQGARRGRLTVRATLAPGWHVYTMTQKSGGPLPTQIEVEPSREIQILRPFVADRAPLLKNEGFPVVSEMYEESVNWTAPFQVAEGVDLGQLPFKVKLNGQICHAQEGCVPIFGQAVPVKFAGEYEPPARGDYLARGSHARIRGQIAPRTVPPGGVVEVSFTAEPTGGYHIYAYAERDPQLISKPTLIAWSTRPDWPTSPVAVSQPPVEHATGLPDEPVQKYHEQPVTWTVKLTVPADAAPGGYELQGILGYQTCTSTGCDLPAAAEFRAVVEVAKLAADEAAEPLEFVRGSYGNAARLAAGEVAGGASLGGNSSGRGSSQPSAVATGPLLELDRLKPVGAVDKHRSMFVILPMAFLAGFFLNFMPCVLPVIGLKLVSFVHQAGEHRSRIFLLNLWYCAGVMAVFMVLASLAVFAGFSWGDQFRSAGFNVVLACVVFAFALSFLGVWEIPLPGFVGSSGVNSVAEREGITGAFFKGALSTVLATPCGGPMLVPALTWAVKQPPLITYTGFAFVGLGMAFPYLLVGAFPRLIALLPKPGDWMETFKHFMGFVLMGTVVFILSYIRIALVIPTVAMMMGLWAGLWWIGRVPVWDELHKRIRAWAWGTATATLVGLMSFLWLDDVMDARFQRDVDTAISERMANPQALAASTAAEGTELPWQPYSLARLSESVIGNRRTVFVDFTADWCATCKWNERNTLNTGEIKSFVDSQGVITLKADMTHEAPEADELKQRLGGSSIPYYAVFPAASPYEPIVFHGLISKSQVLEALEHAVSLKGPTANAGPVISGDSMAAR
jgi:thiol:disulfide interchange protein